MKKGLLIVAAVLLLAGSLQAGEIKLHQWPCQFVATTLGTIPVKMDIGYWIRLKNQDFNSIKLKQKGTSRDYSACSDITFESNFNATLTISIAAVGTKPVGNLSCDFAGTGSKTADIPIGTTTLSICAYLNGANLLLANGGTKDVQVGLITIMVAPSNTYTVTL